MMLRDFWAQTQHLAVSKPPKLQWAAEEQSEERKEQSEQAAAKLMAKLEKKQIDVQHQTQLYKLNEYVWEPDTFLNVEKYVDGDYTHLS